MLVWRKNSDWTTPFLRSPSSYPLQTGSTTLNLTPAHFSSVPLLHCATSLNILLLLSLLIKCNTRETGGVHLSKYAASDWRYSCFGPLRCAVLWRKLLYRIWKRAILSNRPALFMSLDSLWTFLETTIFSMCVWPWENPERSTSSPSVGARRSPQAFLWPPLPSCLTACQCASKTPALC